MTHHATTLAAAQQESTTVKGTHTRDGLIPNLRLVSRDGSITLYAPVKINPPCKGERLPRPQTRDGKMLFALPGGGEVAV